MNKLPIRLAWTDFVLDLHDILLEKQVNVPLYIVGGAVRDAYLRASIKDIDIAVDGNSIDVARNVADWFQGDIFIMDKDRGVARVFVDTDDSVVIIDFARFRGNTLEDDLRDRDFTINAMAAHLLEDVTVLIDPLNGEADLNAKILRHCAEDAIADDPIRILRAIRISSQFKLKIHPDTLQKIRTNIDGLNGISNERIRDEFFNVLQLEKPSRALRVLQHLGALKYIIHDIDLLVDLKQSPPHLFDAWNHTLSVIERLNVILVAISHRRNDNTAANFELGMLTIQLDRYRSDLQAHLARQYGNGRTHYQLMILGALIHNLGKVKSLETYIDKTIDILPDIVESLRLTNAEFKSLVQMIRSYQIVIQKDEWTDLDLHRFWFELDANGIDVILLALADYMGMYGSQLEQLAWLELVERSIIMLDTYFNKYDVIVNPPTLLNGNEIMSLLNLKSSPFIGELLNSLREAQVIGAVSNEEDAQVFLQQRYQEISS